MSACDSLDIEGHVVIVSVLVDFFRVLSHLALRHWLLPITILTDSHILSHGTTVTPRYKTVAPASQTAFLNYETDRNLRVRH